MFFKRSAVVIGIAGLLVAATLVPIGSFGPDVPAAVAAEDVSSCEAITGNDDRSEALRLLCFVRIAKTDPAVCSQSPSPLVCTMTVAGELDDPNVIVENLEGEERDWALLALASSPDSSSDAADLIESNYIHDVAMIFLIVNAFAAAQVEGVVIAPPKDYCARKLKGNYDYYDDDLWMYGLTVEGEVASNTDMCNTVVAALRQLAYGENACDAWLPTVLINVDNAPDGVQWSVDGCNEMAADMTVKMAALGVELVSAPEEEALRDLAAMMGAWVRSAAVVNPGNHETHFVGGQGCDDSNPYWYWYCGPRYIGKTQTITPSATSIAIHDRHVDHGEEWHNVTFTAAFSEPPAILEEGDVIDLSATVSKSGSVTIPSGVGMVFQYSKDGVELDGGVIGVDLVSGGGTITPSFTVPAPSEGGEFKVSAGVWNCSACQVEWVYHAPEMMDIELPPPSESEEQMIDDVVDAVDARPPSEVNDVGKQARIVMLKGDVEIQRYGESSWQPARESDVLRPGDYIRTGSEATASGTAVRLVVSSQGAAATDEAAVINIPADTEVGMTPLFRPDQEEKGFLDLVHGAIRVITNGWDREPAYRVKAGVTLCHIVGSDVIISRDPVAGTESVLVNEGRVDMTSVVTGETKTVAANQTATVEDGAVGESEPLGSTEWEAMVFDQGLDFGGTYRGEPDLALFNPDQGRWHVRYQNGITDSFYYGAPGDAPLIGDWDCDGIDTVAMYRESSGFIYLRNTNDFGVGEDQFYYGIPGDIPIAGDWDGDGCDTFGIYRRGRVFLSNSLGTRPADASFYFGIPGDRPFAGDFNGDGIDTVGLYRRTSGLVYFTDTIPAENGVAPTENQFYYGIPSDRIVAGDWDGDDDDTVGIFRGSDRTFFLSLENQLGNADLTVDFGDSTFLPAVGEFGPGPANPGDIKNCADFSTQAAAQAWYDYYYPGYGDIAHLDAEANGQACESLP